MRPIASTCRRYGFWGTPVWWQAGQAAEDVLPKSSLISIVDDDPPLLDSMRRLMNAGDERRRATPTPHRFGARDPDNSGDGLSGRGRPRSRHERRARLLPPQATG
jgi:hypothetical protein